MTVICVCVCVCVTERERERGGGGGERTDGRTDGRTDRQTDRQTQREKEDCPSTHKSPPTALLQKTNGQCAEEELMKQFLLETEKTELR